MARPVDNNLTEGAIAGHFRSLAIPGAMGMLFNTLYNIVDMYFAGLLGTSAQAGIALGFQAFLIAMSVGFGLGAAMGALVGNALGARDRRQARRTIAQGIVYGVTAACLLGVAGLWYGPLIVRLVSDSGPYQDAGIRYFHILSLALPGFLVSFACNGVLQAHGDGRSMLRALMLAFVANIGLNPLFIYGIPGLWDGIGFDGLAASTVVSQTGVMLFMLRKVFRLRAMARLRARNFHPRADRFREISFQTLPTAVSMLILSLSGFVVQYALKGFGEHAVAGFGLGIRLEQILLLPIFGVSGALLPIASQNFGAKDFQRVRDALRFCWKIGFIMTAIAGPVLWVFGGTVLSFLTDDQEVIRVGVIYLRVSGVILPFYMMLFSINGLLQALKRPLSTVWISLYRQGFGVAFFIWLFVGVWGFDERGVWLGVACAVISGFGLSLWIATRVARQEMDGLFRRSAEPVQVT
ncbi:MATE family efflux transporter [Yoonia sediminilitoris]|uniref:Putative MATE family efflux protein n=1 Tax=Yoonia sediminilitoris TaxID=1286148 RepID=A0A2T6KB48_9RHOB|nr:MATE family efflux transporter [Yoonia sediminilitoris]PUB12041.1 putative MATE family efflux protein [Yoonia sediminilitoris]RCW92868.1 putative MATE family efflux protein [Yoonia sediminilitoris]